MRDRLIEIVKKSLVKNIDYTHRLAENITDDLLAAGVIVPPCKVGDVVWFPSEYYDGAYPITVTRLEVYEEESLLCSEGGSEWHYEDIGKTIFLTKEEAERALAERNGSV